MIKYSEIELREMISNLRLFKISDKVSFDKWMSELVKKNGITKY